MQISLPIISADYINTQQLKKPPSKAMWLTY